MNYFDQNKLNMTTCLKFLRDSGVNIDHFDQLEPEIFRRK